MRVNTSDFVLRLYQEGVDLVGVTEAYEGYFREITKHFGAKIRYKRTYIQGSQVILDDYEYSEYIRDFGYGLISSIRMEGRLRSVVGGKAKLIIDTVDDHH